MNYRHLLCSFSLLALLSACGGSSSSSSSSTEGSLQLKVAAPETTSSQIVSSITRSIDTDNLADYFRNTSFASGKPESLKIYVTNLTLVDDENNITRTVYENDEGAEVSIEGSRVDLDNLFTDYDCIDNNGDLYDLAEGESCDCGFDADNNPLGGVDDGHGHTVCPGDLEDDGEPNHSVGKVATVNVATGTYTSFRMTILRTAKVTGCVTGNYTSGADIATGDFDLDLSNTPGEHTYCTRADFARVNASGGGDNADFEDQDAEEMDLDLASGSDDTESTSISMEFSMPEPLTISPDEQAKLTLFIDTNRFITFYNKGDDGYTPTDNADDVSYFYTPLTQNLMYAFVGHPGSIFGYEMYSVTCLDVNEEDIPEDHICASGQKRVTNSWMTIVRAPNGLDPEGEPLMVNFNTDLGWLNGSNNSSEGLDSSVFTANADNAANFDIGFSSNYPDDSAFTGTLYNMALDGVDVGESIDDVYFISDGTDSNATKNYGVVSVTRRL
ncbi:hypothetical protein K1X76_09965 [bacterium]|nr:hypothetical protein [bacterium]